MAVLPTPGSPINTGLFLDDVAAPEWYGEFLHHDQSPDEFALFGSFGKVDGIFFQSLTWSSAP